MTINIPKNIRQIGECNDCQKIYIEDYVVTFLQQLSTKEENKSVVAALYGKIERDEDKLYAFIMGAAQCDENEKEKALLFSEEDNKIALQIKEHYFSEYDMIGWALLESEEDRIAKEIIVKTKLNQFAEGDRLYYEIHREEETEQFVIFESGMAHTVDGYYIFYDENDGMQNYLVNWNAVQNESPEEYVSDRAIRQFRTIYRNRKEEKSERQIIGLLYTTTLMLLIFCCVIGISMMNNYEKMKGMETALNHLALAMEERRLPDVTQPVISDSIVTTGTPVLEEVSNDISLIEEERSVSENTSASAGEDIGQTTDMTKVSDEGAEETDAQHTLQVAPKEDNTHAVYIVQKNDTLLKISRRFYNSADMIDEICALNQIENPNDIMQQQKILLP